MQKLKILAFGLKANWENCLNDNLKSSEKNKKILRQNKI